MKNKNIKNTFLTVAMGSLLTACGGGGSTDTPNDMMEMDQTAPVITLIGDSSISILVNDAYQDQGAMANDAEDGSVTVNQTGFVNASTSGIYTISYNAMDAAGNAAAPLTRTVTVIGGTRIEVPQTLYSLDYDIYSGFDIYEFNFYESALSVNEGEVVNSTVTFPVDQVDEYYSVNAGEWVGRNPSDFDFERAQLGTVGIVDGVLELTIQNIEDISGQSLVVSDNELDSNLPAGSERYTVKTELLQDFYTVDTKVSFNNVTAQSLDEVLSESCNSGAAIYNIDSDELNDATIPCSQIYQTSGSLVANNSTSGAVVADAGIWSIGKIPGSQIDVLTITYNPTYLNADSYQLTNHDIYAIKDGEVWSGDKEDQGSVEQDVLYNRTAVEGRILNNCYSENASGFYFDCTL